MLQRVAKAVVVLGCCSAVAGTALAKSSGDLVGSVNGETSQKGGKISPTFDVTRGLFYSASGTFRCSGTGTKTYQFYTTGLARKAEPAFHWNRAFTFKLSQKWYASGQNPFKPIRYQEGSVRITITGTIKEIKPAPHGAHGSGKVSGKGSVTFTAPGCSSGKLAWSGTGPLNYF